MLKIPRDAKILSISHYDLDGCGCQIVLCNVFDNVTCISSSFYNLDEKLESIDYSKYDYVIITDIHPENKNLLYLSDKIILIDHHPSDMHDPNNNHFVIDDKGVCATILTKHFCEKMFNEKLYHLNDFAYLVNDYDMWILKDKRSKQLNDLMFHKYKAVKFRQLFMDGRTKFTEDELKWLKEYNDKFYKMYDKLDVYEFEKINACIVNSFHFVNEIAHKLMEEENYNLVIVRNPNTERASVRGNLDSLDIGKILDELGWGGGHSKSAGMFCDSVMDFQNKIKILEEKIYNECSDIRK
ncbi:MAG: hypothetical protein ACOC33_01545 [bacterium]